MSKKRLALLLSAFLVFGCVSPGTDPGFQSVEQEIVSNAEFENFLDQYVVKYCQDNYILTHNSFIHPGNYGIDVSKQKKEFPSIIVSQETIDFGNQVISSLEAMDPRDLNTTNQNIREALLHSYRAESVLYDERFDYIGNAFNSDSGTQIVPVNVLSNFRFYQESDIEGAISLIRSVGKYFDEALEYAHDQADQDLFAINYEDVIASIQSVLDSKDNSVVAESLMSQVDALNLEATKAQNYKDQIQKALEDSFFPAYEKLQNGLEELKDDNQGVKSTSAFPNGKDYYVANLKLYAGTDASIETIKEEVRAGIDEITSDYRKLLRENPDLAISADATTDFSSIDAIIPFLLERYLADFPVVSKINYNLQPASPEECTPSVMAFMISTPFDSREPYQIRYNARDYSSDFRTLEFYKTLAHESVPGHVYQEQYNKEHFKHSAQYLLYNFAFTEGYATYAAYQTLDWTGIDETTIELYKLMDQYSEYTVLLMDLQINYDGYSYDEFSQVWGSGMQPLYDQLCENPGLFFGYYFGSLKLHQLQDIAMEALGSTYDPVRFNDAILQAGSVNFEVVEENVQRYIDGVRQSKYGTKQNDELDSDVSNSDDLNSLYEDTDEAFEEVE